MRCLIALAMCIMVEAVLAADMDSFQVRNTGDLVRVCSVAPGEAHYANAMGLCHGVLVGAYGYYVSAVSAPNRFVCSPNPTPKRSKLMDDFVAWSRGHAELAKDPAVDTLFKYLAETYPCTK